MPMTCAGRVYGMPEPPPPGMWVGIMVGCSMLVGIGISVGRIVGVGMSVGIMVGCGILVGIGISVGRMVGMGMSVGLIVGCGIPVGIGISVGRIVGMSISVDPIVGMGMSVGIPVAISVGIWVEFGTVVGAIGVLEPRICSRNRAGSVRPRSASMRAWAKCCSASSNSFSSGARLRACAIT